MWYCYLFCVPPQVKVYLESMGNIIAMLTYYDGNCLSAERDLVPRLYTSSPRTLADKQSRQHSVFSQTNEGQKEKSHQHRPVSLHSMCVCDSSACCEGEASYSRGERSTDKAERGYTWPWTHFTRRLREWAAATMQEDPAHQGRQTEIEEHVQGQLDGHLLVHPGGHLSTHLNHWLPYRTGEEVMFLSRFWKRAEEIETGINKACMTVLIALPCTSLSVIYYSAQMRGDILFA